MDNELRKTWNILADSWTNLRVRPYEEVLEFSKEVERGIVLDVGCGNSRNLIPFLWKKMKCIGIDFSRNMIKQSKLFLKRRNLECDLIIGDLDNLPIKNNTMNHIICTATIHHIHPKESRRRSLLEIKRVGKNNCRILISVWKRYQKRFFWKLISSLFKGHFADVWVNWNYHGKIYKRFYHLYTKKELKDDLKNIGFDVEKIWENKKGSIWCIVYN